MRRFPSILKAFLTSIVVAIPASVFALDAYPPILCTNLYGCGSPPENVILSAALPTAGAILIQLAAGGAVLAIVISGVQMVVSYGDEGKVGNARFAILYALGGLGLALGAAPIVSFVTSEDYGQDVGGAGGDLLFSSGGVLASVIRIIMLLFNVAFCIVIILAGLRMIITGGNADEYKKGGQMIKWAVVGGVVVNLARSLVHAFLNLNL